MIGNVEGRPCILVDDLIDGSKPYIRAADLLKKLKATKVYVACTHGVWDEKSVVQVHESCIDEVIVMNTVPQAKNAALSSKVKIIDTSSIIGECIRRIHHNESIASLYDRTSVQATNLI